jgi:hypothetical protein
MRFRAVLALAALTFIWFVPTPAGAQGALVSTCAKIIWNYVGKPFAAGAAEKAGGLVAEYFADKIKRGRPPAVEQQDIAELQRRGMSECELRRQIEAMYAPAQPYGFYGQPATYSAEAYCSVTGAIGTAHALPTPEQAISHAIYDCAYRGGIPECCRHGARLVP